MKTLVLGLSFLLTSPICVLAQTKAERDQAKSYGKEAVQLINREVSLDKAINLLEKAKYVDPENINYPFQEARIFFKQFKYQEVVDILTPFVNHEDVNPQIFRLLGRAYKRLTEYDKAIDIYKQGIKQFPNAGVLFHEIGIIQYRKKAYNKSMDSWESGIKADPNFASNYYSLAKLLSYSNETIWAVLYGEIFMNLEPSTERSEEMSKILYNTYKKSIHLNQSGSSVQFTQKEIKKLSKSKKEKVPFQFAFGVSMVNSITEKLSSIETLDLASLNTLRQNFISGWYKDKQNKQYPNTLFDFQKLLIDKGYSDSYNYWMFMHANKEEFKLWVDTHENEFSEFVEWFKSHRVKQNKKHYFSRLQYEV